MVKCVNFIEVKIVNTSPLVLGSLEFILSAVRNCNLNFKSIVNIILSGG